MMTSRTINTALLSYGMSGEVFHGPLLEVHPGFTVTSVWQRTKEKRAKHNYPLVYSLEEILKNTAVELIIVNTPNDSHYNYAVKALEAGKHVVIEKPFTVTTQEADKLITLAKKQNKILTVFQSRRWDGDFLTIKKVVEQKLVGKLVEFEVHYDRFRNYIEAGTWKEKAQAGTGILYNLGSHMLDQVLVLFGMPQYVDARMGVQRPNGEVDDFYDIRLQYKDFFVIVKSSYLVREAGPRYSIHGTEGSFIKYGIDPQEQALKDKKMPGTTGWGTESKESWGRLNTTVNGLNYTGQIETIAGNYLAFYDQLYETIEYNKPVPVKPEESRDVIRLIEACIESNKVKKAVLLSPA
jgi:scyllo-inositol 2-dehydrogenase (NADP+)